MDVVIINDSKKDFLDLLLLADESEEMIDNYDHPMFDNGKQLVDMIYLKKDF